MSAEHKDPAAITDIRAIIAIYLRDHALDLKKEALGDSERSASDHASMQALAGALLVSSTFLLGRVQEDQTEPQILTS